MGRSKMALYAISRRNFCDDTSTSEQRPATSKEVEPACFSSKRKRGKAKCIEVQVLSPRFTAPLEFNNRFQPVGPNRDKFQSFLGLIVRRNCPINITDWRDIDDDLKGKLFKLVEAKFSTNISKEAFYRCVTQSMGAKLKNYRSQLRKKYFSENLSMEKNFKRKPKDVDDSQWLDLVRYFMSTEGQGN